MWTRVKMERNKWQLLLVFRQRLYQFVSRVLNSSISTWVLCKGWKDVFKIVALISSLAWSNMLCAVFETSSELTTDFLRIQTQWDSERASISVFCLSSWIRIFLYLMCCDNLLGCHTSNISDGNLQPDNGSCYISCVWIQQPKLTSSTNMERLSYCWHLRRF